MLLCIYVNIILIINLYDGNFLMILMLMLIVIFESWFGDVDINLIFNILLLILLVV